MRRERSWKRRNFLEYLSFNSSDVGNENAAKVRAAFVDTPSFLVGLYLSFFSFLYLYQFPPSAYLNIQYAIVMSDTAPLVSTHAPLKGAHTMGNTISYLSMTVLLAGEGVSDGGMG